MIEGGTLTPDCNFEVDWSNYDANSIKNEEPLVSRCLVNGYFVKQQTYNFQLGSYLIL